MIWAGGLMVTLWHHRDPAVTLWWHHCDPAVTSLWPAYDITVGWKILLQKLVSVRAGPHPPWYTVQSGRPLLIRKREFFTDRLGFDRSPLPQLVSSAVRRNGLPRPVTPGLWAHGFLSPLIPLCWVIWPRPCLRGGNEDGQVSNSIDGHTGTRAVFGGSISGNVLLLFCF